VKLDILQGKTSKRIVVFIQSSISANGAGLTGLVTNSGGLTWYYWREETGNAAGTIVNIVSATRGTFTSSGFIEIDSSNLPGFYELGVPNAVLATGATWAVMMLQGAANMVPCPVEIQLTAYDPYNATTLGLTNLDAAITTRLAPTTAGRTLDVAATGEAGLDFDNIKDASGAHTLTNIRVPNVTLTDTVTTYTGNTVQTGDAYARIGLAGAGLTALGDTRIANLDATVSSRSTYAGGAVASVTGSVGSVTAAVTVGTNNDKTGYSLSAGQLFIKKNTALANFEFLMVSSTDHITPKTGLTITAQRSIDGGAFAACANAATELSAGIYVINLNASDLNGVVITFKFSGTGADTRYLTMVTQT